MLQVRCQGRGCTAGSSTGVTSQLCAQADPNNANMYIGNLAPDVSDADLKRAVAQFGVVLDVKIYRKGGYAFAQFQTHAEAVQAIVGLSGQTLGGKTLKCSWGRWASFSDACLFRPWKHAREGGSNVLLHATGTRRARARSSRRRRRRRRSSSSRRWRALSTWRCSGSSRCSSR